MKLYLFCTGNKMAQTWNIASFSSSPQQSNEYFCLEDIQKSHPSASSRFFSHGRFSVLPVTTRILLFSAGNSSSSSWN